MLRYYDEVSGAYNFLGNWIEENGYSICGNTRQVAIKGPWNEKNTADYLNEIQIAVKKYRQRDGVSVPLSLLIIINKSTIFI